MKKTHLAILRQGVEAWNSWREKHPKIKPSLRRAELSGKSIFGTPLSRPFADFSYQFSPSFGPIVPSIVDLTSFIVTCPGGANLSRANLQETDLGQADLKGAMLIGASMRFADLNNAKLYRSNLRFTQLDSSVLAYADLRGADLRWADLLGANLTGARLTGADLSRSRMGWTSLAGVDLSEVRGLGDVFHAGPSYIDIGTIYNSEGRIPETFLRNAGVPENFIQYMGSLTEAALEYYSCFISYSSKDQGFAERLYADLQTKEIRCWFAPENLKIGDRVRARIDESIRIYDKLLLVLSQASVASQWVEQEVETALRKEREQDATVLFPIRLDDAVMQKEGGWPALIRNTRHIGDFRNWKDHDSYQEAFGRLLRDLKAEDQATRIP